MSWSAYYEKAMGRPVRPLYAKALSLLGSNCSRALDLGCGSGVESLDLLHRGFQVQAIDQEAKAIEILKLHAAGNSRLSTQVERFELLQDWPSVDFIFAYHSLPFVPKARFKQVLVRAVDSLQPRGLFAFSLFGPQDEWALSRHVTGVSAQETKDLLRDHNILHFDEIKGAGPTALGGEKFWHIFELIVQME